MNTQSTLRELGLTHADFQRAVVNGDDVGLLEKRLTEQSRGALRPAVVKPKSCSTRVNKLKQKTTPRAAAGDKSTGTVGTQDRTIIEAKSSAAAASTSSGGASAAGALEQQSQPRELQLHGLCALDNVGAASNVSAERVFNAPRNHDIVSDSEAEDADSDSEVSDAIPWQDAPAAWKDVFANSRDDRIDFDVIEKAVLEWNRDSDIDERCAAFQEAADDTRAEAVQNELLVRHDAFMRALVGYLNRHWTFIKDLPQTVIIQRQPKPDKDGVMVVDCIKQNEKAFQSSMQNRRVRIRAPSIRLNTVNMVVPKKDVALAVLWLKSPHRLDKSKIAFVPKLPSAAPLADFNLWNGLQITREIAAEAFTADEKSGEEDAHVFVSHIKEVWCQGDEISLSYALNWLAHLIQYPEKKMNVAILLSGTQGAGKGIISMIMRAIIGRPHFTHFTDIKELLGQFNSDALEKCLLGMVDEVSIGGSNRDAHMSILKSLITEDTHRVEAKFMPAYRIDSYSNYIFQSNNEYMIPMDKGERRFFALKVASTWAGLGDHKKAYFKRLAAVSPAAVAHMLFNRDLSNFDTRVCPTTSHTTAMKLHSLTSDSVSSWWVQQLREGDLHFADSLVTENTGAELRLFLRDNTQWEWPRIKSKLYEHYKSSCGQAVDVHIFWPKLKAIAAIASEGRQTVNGSKVGVVKFMSRLECMRRLADDLRISDVNMLEAAFKGSDVPMDD